MMPAKINRQSPMKNINAKNNFIINPPRNNDSASYLIWSLTSIGRTVYRFAEVLKLIKENSIIKNITPISLNQMDNLNGLNKRLELWLMAFSRDLIMIGVIGGISSSFFSVVLSDRGNSTYSNSGSGIGGSGNS